MEKIAIIADSATDITENLGKGHTIFQIPLQINIDGKSYIAGRDITGEEVFQAMEKSTVSSSLPNGKDIEDVFNRAGNQVERELTDHNGTYGAR